MPDPVIQWYAGFIKDKFLDFKPETQVFYRRAHFQSPLKGGNVFIIFDMENKRSFRIFESLGVKSVLNPWPNNVNPKPAPEKNNVQIEHAYQRFLEKHPPGKRLPLAERLANRVLFQGDSLIV
jgi:hypothetical protein